MNIRVNVQLRDKDGNKFMGPGPYALLKKVEEFGSIRQAALEMGMSYAKAHNILKKLESMLGFKLMDKFIGGAQHGGSELTKEARRFLEAYEKILRRVNGEAQAAFADFCIELESGPKEQSH